MRWDISMQHAKEYVILIGDMKGWWENLQSAELQRNYLKEKKKSFEFLRR